MGSTPTSHHHGYEFPQRERTDNPYTRYAPAPAHSSASSSSTVRPDLSRQTSMDSLASRSSFASARSSHSSFSQHQAARDTLSPLSDGPSRWPGAPSFGNGWGQLQQQQQHPPPQQVTSPGPGEAGNRGSMYFPPAGAPTSRQNSVDEGMRPSEGGPVKLPSLSAVLGGAIPPSTTTADGFSSAQAPPRQVTFNHPQPFSPPTAAAHRPPPPAPSSGARNYGPHGMPPPSPTTSQANASSRPFDDGFSRLRISSEGPISPTTRQASPPDLLDAAMETVYRPSKVNPPRSSLPPLRFTHSGRAIHTSEADAALLAPILPPITLSGASTPKTLPPLSSLALSSPTHPFPSRASTWSQQSGASTSSAGHTRSSVSSFDWGGGPTLAAPGASGSSFASSSRTSFSSEVQEEWDRIASASAGRKVKTEVTGGFGGWEPESKGRTVGATQALMSDVRMQG